MTLSQTKRLLIVDDEPEIGSLVAEVATELGIETLTTTSPFEFKSHFPNFKPHFVCLDLEMPDGGGTPLLAWINKTQPNSPPKIILMSGAPELLKTAKSLADSAGLPIVAALGKPSPIEELYEALTIAKMDTD